MKSKILSSYFDFSNFQLFHQLFPFDTSEYFNLRKNKISIIYEFHYERFLC